MTSDASKPYADPLIDEVRQRRRELFAECGNDLNKLFELIQRIQARHPEELTDLRKVRLPTLLGLRLRKQPSGVTISFSSGSWVICWRNNEKRLTQQNPNARILANNYPPWSFYGEAR